MNTGLTEKYRLAPHCPGVYLMKDGDGKIIYVGKANDLKKRLASYFGGKTRTDAKTAAMLAMVRDFDLVLTASGHEAFILESTLIKEHAPKYNVILKDGKNYPLLRIDLNEEYPAITRVRKIAADHALYFGPYSSSLSLNRTLKRIQQVFRLRKCRNSQFKNRSRPCLNYQIKACLGLCCNMISPREYQKQIQDAILFLKGKTGEVAADLNRRMSDHSAALEYEKAARIRDTLAAIRNIMERQAVVSPDLKDRDVIARASDRGKIVITVMMVRSGVLMDTAHYVFDLGFKDPDELIPAFLQDYYSRLSTPPADILLDRTIENLSLIADRLSAIKPGRVSIHVPARGEKKRLTGMAAANARQELEKQLLKEEESQSTLLMLKTLLEMDRIPARIECFDNSSLAGLDPVSAMVVFRNGRPSRPDYRKYILRDMTVPDDYAAMTQVLARRFSKNETEVPFPDLLLVDGGKGQLNMALMVLKDLGIQNRFTVAGLAKKDGTRGEILDKIYVPGRQNPLNTSQSAKALFLLQQVRDEAHRFAVTFQRSRREKRAGRSVLDSVPGIGPDRKKRLLRHFRGIAGIKASTVEEIASLPGITRAMAQSLLETLKADS